MSSVTASDLVRAVAPRIEATLARHGARLALDLRARADLGAAHLGEPLATVLLVLAAHTPPGATMRLVVRDLAGADAEVVCEGPVLPPGFPEGEPMRDLWELARGFLVVHHRARIAQGSEATRILLPHGARAARLRQLARVAGAGESL